MENNKTTDMTNDALRDSESHLVSANSMEKVTAQRR